MSVELAPVQAVIFGLHGILLADTKLDRLLTSELLQNWGIVLRPGEYREVFLERSDALGLRIMLERRGRAVNDEIIAELVQKKQLLYRSYLEREIPRIEGVEDCLQLLQARGIPCILVSNESQSPWIVEHLGYGQYFKALFMGEGSAIYAQALQLLAVEPWAVLLIECSYPPLIAAQTLGIQALGLPTRLPLHMLQRKVDWVVDNYAQIDWERTLIPA